MLTLILKITYFILRKTCRLGTALGVVSLACRARFARLRAARGRRLYYYNKHIISVLAARGVKRDDKLHLALTHRHTHTAARLSELRFAASICTELFVSADPTRVLRVLQLVQGM